MWPLNLNELDTCGIITHTISSCPLIVNTADWIPTGSFQTRPEGAIHLLLHLSVSSLHCTQVPVTGVVALHLQTEHSILHIR